MVYVLLADGFEEAEALVTVDVLRRGGCQVATVGVTGAPVTGAHNITVMADLPVRDVNLDAMDMVVVPGGLGGVNAILDSAAALAVIQKAAEYGVYVAAICAAPTILANLGFLDRRRAVCYPGMEELMGSAVVQKGAPVVVDGHIVTAEAAGSAFPFGLKLVEVLKGADAARAVCDAVHYHG